MALFKMAPCATKALSLQKDLIFRLLVTMTILIGWLSGLGVGLSIGLENVYASWRLSQENEISIYLLASSDLHKVASLEKSLIALPSVSKVVRQKDADVKKLMQTYFEETDILPTPVVLDVTVSDSLDRDTFDAKVYDLFVDARIDDSRTLLEKIAYIVRFSQLILLIFAFVIALVMTAFVSLTVRAGLRGKQESLAVLQYVGATNRFMTALILRQVMKQVMIGWAIAAVFIVSMIQAIASRKPEFEPYISDTLYIGALSTPGFLALIALLTAWGTSRHVIYKKRKEL